MMILTTITTEESGAAQTQVFKDCLHWLSTCKDYLKQKNVIEKLEEGVTTGCHAVMLDNMCNVLSYVSRCISI